MQFLSLYFTVILLDLIPRMEAGLLNSFTSILSPGGIDNDRFDKNKERANDRGNFLRNPEISQPVNPLNQNYGNSQPQPTDRGSREVYNNSPTNNRFEGNIERGYDRAKSWWNPQVNKPSPTIQSSDPKLQLTDKEREEISKVFPGGINLLNKLQELNKLKEEGKLSTSNANKPDVQTTTPVNKNLDKDVTKPTESSKVKDPIRVLKPVTKKKFYYQAQPVIPENERRDVNETIYYVD